MSDLQRGRLFFSIEGFMFFSGVITLGILITYGITGASYMGIGIAISGIGMMLGLPMLMIVSALLFRNRRLH